MEMNEFIIAGGCLIAGVVFLIAASNYMSGQTKQADISMNQKDAQRIVSLIEKISNQPYDSSAGLNLSLCDISVINGTLTFSKGGKSSSEFVPNSVKNADLKEIASICVYKTGEEVSLLEHCPSE
jgi:hypothetical protein